MPVPSASPARMSLEWWTPTLTRDAATVAAASASGMARSGVARPRVNAAAAALAEWLEGNDGVFGQSINARLPR